MIDIEKQKAKAHAFRAMHRGPQVLVLANTWDVASARIRVEARCGVVATWR
jgi:2-methylisocitrate lyase-like PEP mutase family enzyme